MGNRLAVVSLTDSTPYPMRCLWVALLALAAIPSWAEPSFSLRPWSAEAEAVYTRQLERLDLPFRPYYDEDVRHFLRRYVETGRRQTELILGRTRLYFPIFEYWLDRYDLPDGLKYLPFIESRLIPDVVSPAEAGGCWQFIPATARLYGLRRNSYVDERFDVYRSTEAAVRLLAELYEDFGDWQLVIAAYNCGPARVLKAMEQTGCSTYAEIEHLLPGQTRKYIPKFIAAAYIANYYGLHRLRPVWPDWEVQDFQIIHLRQRVSFRTIARVARIDKELIRRLNPAYRRDVVPGSGRGGYLMLPAEATARLAAYLQEKQEPVLLESKEPVSRKPAPAVAWMVRYTRDCLPPPEDTPATPPAGAAKGSFAVLSLDRRGSGAS